MRWMQRFEARAIASADHWPTWVKGTFYFGYPLVLASFIGLIATVFLPPLWALLIAAGVVAVFVVRFAVLVAIRIACNHRERR